MGGRGRHGGVGRERGEKRRQKKRGERREKKREDKRRGEKRREGKRKGEEREEERRGEKREKETLYLFPGKLNQNIYINVTIFRGDFQSVDFVIKKGNNRQVYIYDYVRMIFPSTYQVSAGE